MSRGKKIYIGIIILCIVLVSVFYFSYALFTSKYEAHGKLNITVGTLDYKIENKYLENNQITLGANQVKLLNIKITSLNTIDSKYELYYNADDSVDVTYLSYSKNIPTGEVVKKGTKEVTVRVTNNSNEEKTVTFGVEGGFSNKDLTLTKGKAIQESTLYAENTLNGADPVTTGDLVPVNISTNGIVTKANVEEQWYSYENKQWANAIVPMNSYDLLNANGKVSGAVKQDGGVYFDGEDDYINLGLENYNFGNCVTLAIRLKFNSLNYQEFFDNFDAGGLGLMMYEKKIHFNIYIDDYVSIISDSELNANTEYTILGVYDGNQMKIYINGTMVAAKAVNGNIKAISAPILLGANPQPSGHHLSFSNVTIYESAIFDRALSESEIQNNYSGEFNIQNATDLLSYQNFSNRNLNNNEVIPEDNIKQYYVWIPRYKYQLWNVGSGTLASDTNYPNGTEYESAINIVFENVNTTASTGSNNGEWLTHPAFTNFDTNGIWVGKFETSYNENSFTNSNVFATTNPNISAVTSGSNIIIKPNVRSLTKKNVSEFYTLGREIDENLNSHMMTNMEWGATAYLTYSLYGKCDSNGCEEVYMNNVNTGHYPEDSMTYQSQWQYGTTITGCSGSSGSPVILGTQSSCAENYKWNEINNNASTTGNVSGIYDMNGGNWEYVMGVNCDSAVNPISGRNNLYNSGFNGTYGCPTCDSESLLEKTNGTAFPTDNRYYNLYAPYSTTLGDGTWWVYANGLLGDATKEIANTKVNSSSGDRGLWYNDYAKFVTNTSPWFQRGGNFGNGNGSGVFNFISTHGYLSGSGSFRVTLAY